MPMPKTLRKWFELAPTYLLDDKQPGRFEATMFVNSCELRESSKGQYIVRSTGCHTVTAETMDGLDEKVANYAQREDVRQLADGVQSNDFDTLPRRDNHPAQDVIDGTADIYQFEDEPAKAS